MLYPDTTSSLPWLLGAPALCAALISCTFLSEMQSNLKRATVKTTGNLARMLKIHVFVKDAGLGEYKMCNTFLMCKRTLTCLPSAGLSPLVSWL